MIQAMHCMQGQSSNFWCSISLGNKINKVTINSQCSAEPISSVYHNTSPILPLPGQPPWNPLPALNDLQLSAPPSRPPVSGRCYGAGKTSSRTVNHLLPLCFVRLTCPTLYYWLLFFIALKGVVPRSVTSFKRQRKTEAFSMVKVSGTGPCYRLWHHGVALLGNVTCWLMFTFKKGIVCSRKVCSKLKQQNWYILEATWFYLLSF